MSERPHIVVFGGTFDPIHHGHLRSAVEVREALGAEELWLLPSHQPPLRDEPAASSAQRLAMVSVAIRGESGLKVDGRELLRDEPSYTVNTLREIRREIGAAPALSLVLGSDALNRLHKWREWQALLELCNLLVLGRPEFPLQLTSEVASHLNAARCDVQALGQRCHGGFAELQLVQLAISATAIRQRRREGKSIRYLVPDSVLAVIEDEKLYC